MNRLTREPVAKVVISAVMSQTPGPRSQDRPATRTAISNASGQFVLANLPSGRYAIFAARNGFLPLSPTTSQSEWISVGSGERVTDITIAIEPAAVIAGRILDEDGEPVPRVAIRALREAVFAGRKRFEEVSLVTSNDLGEYRAFELPPGKYRISATPQPAPGLDVSDLDNAVTYFPGATSESAAQSIQVKTGDHIEGANIALRKARAVTLSGHVTGAAEGSNVFALLTGRGPYSSRQPLNSLMHAGEFSFNRVMPGSYYVNIREIRPNGGLRTASREIEVAYDNIEDLTLELAAPITASGRLRIEGVDRMPDSLSLRLMPRNMQAMFGAAMEPPPPVKRTGAEFQVQNAVPGSYLITLNTPNLYVKRVRVGGVETTAPLLELAGAVSDIEVTLGSKPAALAGSVYDPVLGKPAPNAFVVLVPREPDRRDIASLYAQARTDASGRFRVPVIVPGKYTAYAWPRPESAAYMEADFMKAFEGRGADIDASEGAVLEVSLTLLPETDD